MRTKTFFLTLALVVVCACASYSQGYKSAIGLRLGAPVSISFKHFISEPGAIELFAGFYHRPYWNYFNVGALYQHHFPINGVEGLRWYVGGGAAAYFWTFDDVYYYGNDYANTSVGILGDLGLDYKFAEVPINLSLDWVPAFFIGGFYDSFRAGYGALSARYTFR